MSTVTHHHKGLKRLLVTRKWMTFPPPISDFQFGDETPCHLGMVLWLSEAQ